MKVELLNGSVLIDNATLRGALVALGLIEPSAVDQRRGIKMLDTHILSAQILIESIVLHNRIYVPKIHIENYPATVEMVQSVIGKDIVSWLPLTEREIKAIQLFAQQDFSLWPLSDAKMLAHLRKFTGVEANITEWDKWIYQYYSSGASWFRDDIDLHIYRQQISDYRIQFLDVQNFRSGFPLPSNASDIPTIDTAIIWLAYRTCLYDCIAWALKVPYIPHPQRSSVWKAVNIRRSNPETFLRLPYDVLTDIRLLIGKQINESIGYNVFQLDIPPFFAYVLNRSDSKESILENALVLRNSSGAKSLRSQFHEVLRHIETKSDPLFIQKMRAEYHELKRDLEIKYLVSPSAKISPSIQIGAFGVEFEAPIPREIHRIISKFKSLNKPHIAILRDVFENTIKIWEMSGLYDKMFQGKVTAILPPRAISMNRNSSVIDVDNPELITPRDFRARISKFLHNKPQSRCILILLDIDDLDMVNGRRGRISGDRMIRQLLLRINSMNVDIISRAAGDTFMVGLLETASSNDRSDWIKLNGERLTVDFIGPGEEPIMFTASVGLAVAPDEESEADSLLKLAYERLMRAKQKKPGS